MSVPAWDPNGAALEVRELSTMTDRMRELVEAYVLRCANRGVKIAVYCTWRSERTQAIRFRRNRSRSAVMAKANELDRRGFPQLAQLLVDVGPQPGTNGRIETNAGPGESLHQHGLAIDRCPVVDGEWLWKRELPSDRRASGGVHPAWLTSEQVARELGLERLSWEAVHLQMPGYGRDEAGKAAMAALMRQRYGPA